VWGANRAHLDDVAVDQLHALLAVEDAHLGHTVVFVDGESPSRQGSRHSAHLLTI
jgi:hypothetical protein